MFYVATGSSGAPEFEGYMRHCNRELEPMCVTSERNERLISRDEILPIGLDIGRRVMEVFGYQKIANIVFRLKSNSREIDAVINKGQFPSTELLLCIRRATGVSIDWILTGEGPKFLDSALTSELSADTRPVSLWFPEIDQKRPLALQ